MFPYQTYREEEEKNLDLNKVPIFKREKRLGWQEMWNKSTAHWFPAAAATLEPLLKDGTPLTNCQESFFFTPLLWPKVLHFCIIQLQQDILVRIYGLIIRSLKPKLKNKSEALIFLLCSSNILLSHPYYQIMPSKY